MNHYVGCVSLEDWGNDFMCNCPRRYEMPTSEYDGVIEEELGELPEVEDVSI